MDRSARRWAGREGAARDGLLRLGYFGSYARGDWGVGSDLDLVAIVLEAEEPFERRSNDWDLNGLPVPAELLVYTKGEWDRLVASGGRFARTLEREIVWVFPRGAGNGENR